MDSSFYCDIPNKNLTFAPNWANDMEVYIIPFLDTLSYNEEYK